MKQLVQGIFLILAYIAFASLGFALDFWIRKEAVKQAIVEAVREAQK